jgi:hypothetical protein
VAEEKAPVLTLLGARFTRTSLVLLHLRSGRKTQVLRVRPMFLSPEVLRVRLPLLLASAFAGDRFALDDGRETSVSVFTPGVGETVAVPLAVLEDAVPGRMADPREEAVLEFLERRAHREVTLDDFVPRALDSAFVDLMFRRFHIQA